MGKFSFFSFSFLTIPQFGLFSHVSSARLSSGHSGLVLTLRTSDAACASLSSPLRWWRMRASGLLLRWQLRLGGGGGGFFSSLLCYPWDSKTPHRPACERVSYCLETSPSWQPPWNRSPSLTLLFLFLSSIFCPTSFRREWAAFQGAWCPLPAFGSCFVEVAQHSNDFLMNLWGRKWSPLLFLHHLGTAPWMVLFWSFCFAVVATEAYPDVFVSVLMDLPLL